MFQHLKNPGSAREMRKNDRIDGSSMIAKINGVPCELVDYSKGGVRVRLEGEALQNAVIEILRHGRVVHEAGVFLVWNRGNEAGYAFE